MCRIRFLQAMPVCAGMSASPVATTARCASRYIRTELAVSVHIPDLASSKVVLPTKLMPVPLPKRTFLVDKPCLGGVRAAASKSFAITNCLIFNHNCAGGNACRLVQNDVDC